MADWEGFRVFLNELYLVEKKPLVEVMEIMAKEHKFTAAKHEYLAQFNKWNWHKSIKKSDWIYVARKIEQRKEAGRLENAVYIRGVLVPAAKVKKDVSRHVHPNEFYKFGAQPPSPGNITVCTPPPDDLVPGFTTGKRRPEEMLSIEETPGPKRRQMEGVNTLISINGKSSLSQIEIWRNRFHEIGEVDLSGLPYFQFRDILNSPDVRKGFEQILTSNDALAGKLVCNFWPRPSDSSALELNSSTNFYLESNSELDLIKPSSLLQIDQTQLFKPFGANFWYGNGIYEGFDTIDVLHKTRMDLSSLLSNMPQSSCKEVQMLADTLLGPPTIEAARRFVEVGVYVSSNNLWNRRDMDPFIGSMLQTIPWSVLEPILSAQVPTIQAFAEKVFMFAINKEMVHVVQHLLCRPFIIALVRPSIQALLAAIHTSNTELVSLLVEAGANFKGDRSDKSRPLIEARTVDIAHLLVDAGADINATGLFSDEYPKEWSGAAVHRAIFCKDVDMTRYLIGEGANIDICNAYLLIWPERSRVAYSALMLSVEGGSVDICRMLLQAGLGIIDVVIDSLPECKHCTEGLDYYISHKPHDTVFQRAAAYGNVNILELLLQHNAKVNVPAEGTRGKTALEAAVSQGQMGAVKFLLANGANVNTPGNSNTFSPRYVLTTAVEMNHYEMVETLLDSGAEVNVASFGKFGSLPLESAAMIDESSDVYKLLVSRGALRGQASENTHQFCQVRLQEAVSQGDLPAVRKLVATGMSIDMDSFLDETYPTALTILQLSIKKSISSGTEIFHLLFRAIRRSEEDIDFCPLLVEAIEIGDLEILAVLLDAGANVNATHKNDLIGTGTPLMFAVKQKVLNTVRFLLDKGADVNAVVEGFKSSLTTASTALQVALQLGCYSDSHDIYHLLLDRGATINAPVSPFSGHSELSSAVKLGEIDLVKHFLELGARVNDPPAPEFGQTALQAAGGADVPNISIIRLLLEWGADVNGLISRIGGKTALSAAAFEGHFQIGVILLEAGVAVNGLNSDGQTALVGAASYGRLDMVHLLLKAGADSHLPANGRYVEAVYEARRMGNIAIVSVLEKWREDEGIRDSIDMDTLWSNQDSRKRMEQHMPLD